jgi:hypothetical protein
MHGTHQGNSVLLLFAVATYSIRLECMGLFNCYVSLTALHRNQGLFNIAYMDVRYKLTIFSMRKRVHIHRNHVCHVTQRICVLLWLRLASSSGLFILVEMNF